MASHLIPAGSFITPQPVGVVTCPPESNVPLYPGSSFTYTWGETEVGRSLSQECPQECSDVAEYAEDAALVRRCVEVEEDAGEWMMVELTGCQLSRIALDLCEASLQVCVNWCRA